MTVYNFLVPKGIGGVQAAAERCGLTPTKTKNGWRFSGNVIPANARVFASYLATFKLEYKLERPSFAKLADVDLVDVVFEDGNPMRNTWKAKDNVYSLMQRRQRVGDLPSCRFEDVIATLRGQSIGSWHDLAVILRFMIEHEIDFQDLSPREKFTTPVEELRLMPRVNGRLKAAGFWWVELLEYVTIGELFDIREFGEKSLAELRAKLPKDHPLNRR